MFDVKVYPHLIKAEIMKLPKFMSDVIILRYWHGLLIHEISSFKRMSWIAVDKTLEDAHNVLRGRYLNSVSKELDKERKAKEEQQRRTLKAINFYQRIKLLEGLKICA